MYMTAIFCVIDVRVRRIVSFAAPLRYAAERWVESDADDVD